MENSLTLEQYLALDRIALICETERKLAAKVAQTLPKKNRKLVQAYQELEQALCSAALGEAEELLISAKGV